MSIFLQLKDLEKKVDYLFNKMPEWIPISSKIADEKGFRTIDGFRKYCIHNVHPNQFQKFGKFWHIHRDAWLTML